MPEEKTLPKALKDEGAFWNSITVLKVGMDTFTTEFSKGFGGSEGGKKFFEATDKAKEVVESAIDAGGKLVDNISGAEAVTRINDLLAGQRRYNDILATRLAEALDRIELLEAEVKRLSDGR